MVRGSDNYLGGIGVLPFPLRGDADGLPVFDLDDALDQKDVAAALTAFGKAWREHDEREERRLAYVAVTRPRRLLLCSGYWWGDGVKRPRGPSVFLREIQAACATKKTNYRRRAHEVIAVGRERDGDFGSAGL